MTAIHPPTMAREPGALLDQWRELLAAEPGLRARNAAARLGVSEGELVAARCPAGVTRLAAAESAEHHALLRAFTGVGEVMALTRNEHVVHERHGGYQDLRLTASGGVALGPEIDLRFNFRHWAHAFAVTDESPRGSRESVQVFDRDGTAVHKVYRTDATDRAAWRDVVARFAAADQTPGLAPEPPSAGYPTDPPAEHDGPALREAWRALPDVHAFHPMLRRQRLRRIDAIRLAGDEQLARPVAGTAWRRVIDHAADAELPIMIFVGSAGVIQIHSGPVSRRLRRDGWFNILDPRFNLHLREDAVAENWVVHKPTNHGGVTSLEVYDAAGELIVQFFGQREPGQAERDDWRALLAALPTAAGAPTADAVSDAS